jgi:hypothetical protein
VAEAVGGRASGGSLRSSQEALINSSESPDILSRLLSLTLLPTKYVAHPPNPTHPRTHRAREQRRRESEPTSRGYMCAEHAGSGRYGVRDVRDGFSSACAHRVARYTRPPRAPHPICPRCPHATDARQERGGELLDADTVSACHRPAAQRLTMPTGTSQDRRSVVPGSLTAAQADAPRSAARGRCASSPRATMATTVRLPCP